MTTYSVWYGLTGKMVEYTPERGNTNEYSVRAYNIDLHSAYYVKRADLARILRDGRNMAHMSVAIYNDRNGWR